MEKHPKQIKNYNEVEVPTLGDAIAWSEAHPEVPVKIVREHASKNPQLDPLDNYQSREHRPSAFPEDFTE